MPGFIKEHIIPILFCIGLLTFTGCELIEYHPYDTRIRGEKDINRTQIEILETACSQKETIRFVLMGDSQRRYDDTEDFVRNVNSRNDIDFVIHGGDISDFGLTREFTWTRDIMNKLNVPYVSLIGNHDVLGNGKAVFEKIFGPENFSFIAGKTKFVCLNTNALEYDYSHPVPDFNFLNLEMENRLDEYTQTVAVMHAKPYCEQFNNNVAEYFHYTLKNFTNLRFCLHAHDHNTKENDIFGDNLIYYGCPSMDKRSYLLFTLTQNEHSYEEVFF
ncbi:metallophosphoesterase family protein [Coprobacter sp.]